MMTHAGTMALTGKTGAGKSIYYDIFEKMWKLIEN
jgi:DNA repair ATPase RecN